MYSSNLTDRYEIPTSDIERSRRYGAGIYPDPMRGYPPVSQSIFNVRASPAQRIPFHNRQESPVPRGSIAANITTMTGEILPSHSTDTQSSVPHAFNLERAFANLNVRDPFQGFILQPHDPSRQDAIYNTIACKDLPSSVREKELKFVYAEVRNLLGMIFLDVLPEDKPRLKRCFAMLKKAEYNLNREHELGKDVNFLMRKYGEVALLRHYENFAECCRKVWNYYNLGHANSLADEQLFTFRVSYYKQKAIDVIKKVINPGQVLIITATYGVYLSGICGQLACTIPYDAEINIPPESLTETVDSIYSARGNDLTNVNDQNDYEIEDAECLNDTLTTWERIEKILCCGM